MAFQIAAGECSAPIIHVSDIHDNFRSGGLRLLVDYVAVGDDQAGRLGFYFADFVWLSEELAVWGPVDSGTHHHHAVPEGKLRVGDRAVGIGIDGLFFKAEYLAEPFDCGGRVPGNAIPV